MTDKYSILPGSGAANTIDPSQWPNLLNALPGPSGSLSAGGWTEDNEGFVQQTFLGASIKSFNINAGFGDSSTQLSLSVVNDEFNKSDGFGLGAGDDPYHNGKSDEFKPPVVGAPVFFKFGKNFATVEQAWRQTFDDLYDADTMGVGWDFPETDWVADPEKTLLKQDLAPYHYVNLETKKVVDKSALWEIDTKWRGQYHFAFGGILQSYTQNRGQGGNPVYNVNVTDPREILSNAQLLFNNYQGTTFNNKNLFNVYGFLEYDPSDGLQKALLSGPSTQPSLGAFPAKKVVNAAGNISYVGVDGNGNVGPIDMYTYKAAVPGNFNPNGSPIPFPFPATFPITGQGFSRRSEKGIPFYRVREAINALFEYNGFLPPEYKGAGFGGQIDFRGYNYVVDFSGLPTHLIPDMYYMDFDQMDMLSFAQEVCDIISHDLYVQLLPVIDHPACSFLHSLNQYYAANGQYSNMVHGIIRLDAINKTVQPKYGAIKEYLDTLAERGIYTTNQDVGYEVSNVTTDKFVVGAQETEMYFFSAHGDRDSLQSKRSDFVTLTDSANLNVRILEQEKWQLETMEKQQILPYYGLLGKDAVSIPRGWGAYQQILLDARGLDAHGVGNYYVATEIELRAALVSFERWKDFLLSYNDTYIQDISEHQAFIAALADGDDDAQDQFTKVLDDFENRLNLDDEDPVDAELKEKYIGSMRNREFAVTVPRSMWDSDRPWMAVEGYPASPCSPPYGYPLYYQRATAIGIPEAGVAEILADKTAVISNLAKLEKAAGSEGPMSQISSKKGLETLRDKYNKRLMDIRNQWEKNNINDPEGYINDPEYMELAEKLDQAEKVLANFSDKVSASLHRRQLIADTNEYLESDINKKFLYNLQKTAKYHLDNAKKVYEFVRKVASDNLGRKFLVKIPKACNLRFQPNIKCYSGDETEAGNFGAGPFGFTPRPINSDAGYAQTDDFVNEIKNRAGDVESNDLFNHFTNSFIGKTAVGDWKKDRTIETNKVEHPYTYGALKNNYNPFAEKWEFNYMPDNQGGWFPFSIFQKNISYEEYRNILQGKTEFMPLAQSQGIAPIDMTNLMTRGNRVKPYVIYVDSQFNDMSMLSKKDFTQQENVFDRFLPDVAGLLDNLNNDKELSFNRIQERLNENSNDNQFDREETQTKKTLAYISVTVDDKLYMPPRLEQKEVDIWAREYELAFSEPLVDVVRKTDASGCTSYELDYKRAVPIFTVPVVDKREEKPRIPFEDAGGRDGTKAQHVDFKREYDPRANGYIVDTQLENLDSNNVYALITVPGKIVPTVDRRWVDGPLQSFNTVKMKNLMMADVVKNSPHFDKPSLPTPSAIKFICSDPEYFDTRLEAEARAKELGITGSHHITFWTKIFGFDVPSGIKFSPGESPEIYQKFDLQDLSSAQEISRKAKQGVAFNDPLGKLAFISPSPVYPDMAVIPLMSMERCYGPWISSSVLDATFPVKYSNIGGKVEFVKDENLAPWNYFGYQLMNEAGSLQANFSNSLLLFSERGGFVYPAAPTGVNLARALQNEGPLVTSISVDVGQGGVKTTVKLDLYTSQFGKLAKQKEMAISQIARERQKLSDERNAAIRRGRGKAQTASNLMDALAGPAAELANLADRGEAVFTEQEQGKQKDYLMSLGVDGGKLTTGDDIKVAMENMEDKKVREEAVGKAVVDLGEMFVGFAFGQNEDLPSTEYLNEQAIREALEQRKPE